MELLVTSGARLLSERESTILSCVVIFDWLGGNLHFQVLDFLKNVFII